MKAINVLTILLLCSLIGCSKEKSEHKNTFVPNEVDFEQIETIDGLADFIVGSTTFQSYSRRYRQYNRRISLATYYDEEWSSPWDVEWGKAYKEFNYDDRVKLIDNLKKNKSIRSIKLSNYKVGEIELQNFYLAFFTDTLVALRFEPDKEHRMSLRDHYLVKYGCGKGFSDTLDFLDVLGRYSIKEEREWSNQLLTATYYRTRLIDKDKGYDMDENVYFYWPKRLYPMYVNVIEDEIQKHQESKSKSINNSLTAF